MTLLTVALCGLALAPAAMAQPAGDAFADPKANPVPPAVANAKKDFPGAIVVNVLADGNVMIDGMVLTLAELETQLVKAIQKNPDQPVHLKNEKDLPYQRMLAVMDLCKKVNARILAIDQESARPTLPLSSVVPEPKAKRLPDIKVQILRDGNVMVDEQTLTLAELEARLVEIRKTVVPPYVGIINDGTPSKQQVADVNQILKKTGSELVYISLTSSDLLIRYEVFSIDPGTAAAMRREKPADGKFYADLVSLVEKGDADQESLMVVRCASGQKAKLESVNLEIYPTEWDPQPAGSLPAAQGENPPKAVVPVMAESFENRQAGEELEVEPTRMHNSPHIELKIIATHTSLAERTPWGKDTSLTEMPIFETQRINTNANGKEGEPFLLSTMNPPLGSKVHPNRIWFAFTTVSFAD